MSKEKLLEILMLLSALESWGYSNKMTLPDYLTEQLGSAIDALMKEVLREK